MKKFYIRVATAFTTLTIGVSAFYFNNLIWNAFVEKNIQGKADAAQIEIQNKKDKFDFWALPKDFPPLKQGEFFLVAHGCGNGYAQGWLAYDNSHLSAGFLPKGSFDLKAEIARAEKTLETKENFIDRDGKKGLRVILQGRDEGNGDKFYKIIWYNKKIGTYYVSGPKLEITLELEKYLGSK